MKQNQYFSLFTVLFFAPLIVHADPGYEYADSNQDGVVNILDIVTTVQLVLGEAEAENEVAFGNADVNCDGNINILDIVPSVAVVLGESDEDTYDACWDDDDADGYPAFADCDNADSNVNPSAEEILGNGIDDDCDGDTVDPVSSPCAAQDAYIDANSMLTVVFEYWKWDGLACVMFSGPGCAGADCDAVFDTQDDCQNQYGQCEACVGSQCGMNGDEPCVCGARCHPCDDGEVCTDVISNCQANGLCAPGTPGTWNSIAEEYESPPCAESYPGSCGPQDAVMVGDCRMMSTMFKWDGYQCVPMGSGCECQGADCDQLYPRDEENTTRSTACELAHWDPASGFCQGPCETAKDCAIMNIETHPQGGVGWGICSSSRDNPVTTDVVAVNRDLGRCFGITSPGYFTCEEKNEIGRMGRVCVPQNGLGDGAAVPCGDGKCDIHNGESPQSCPNDCLADDNCGPQLMYHIGYCLPFAGYYWDGQTCQGNMLSGCYRGGPDYGDQYPSIAACNDAHSSSNIIDGNCACGHEPGTTDSDTGEMTTLSEDCWMAGGSWNWGSCECLYDPAGQTERISLFSACSSTIDEPAGGFETASGDVFASRDGSRIDVDVVLLGVNIYIAQIPGDTGPEFVATVGESSNGEALVVDISANDALDWPNASNLARGTCDIMLQFSYQNDDDASVYLVQGFMANTVDFFDGGEATITTLPPNGFIGSDELAACAAQDVAALNEVQCLRANEYWYWDGNSCATFSACDCTGTDCATTYASYFDCRAAHEGNNCCLATQDDIDNCSGVWDWDTCGCEYGQDCDGRYPDIHHFYSLLGDGVTCHDGRDGNPNFNCMEWNFDNGDCDLPCGWEPMTNFPEWPEIYQCEETHWQGTWNEEACTCEGAAWD